MSQVIWDPQTWAEREFGHCVLGDKRRNIRLIKLAKQVAARPDGSTPDQTETWGELKGAYRFFGEEDVTFQAIIAPHCERVRGGCLSGDVKLILNDTTELDYTNLKQTTGLGPIGNGGGNGFFLHSGLMVDAASGHIEGMAGQEIFYRPKKAKKKPAKNTRRRSADRESAVWGRVIERIGSPPPGVKWIHVCDRGADDFEVLLLALHHHCGFVIRASHLNRKVLTTAGEQLHLAEVLEPLPVVGAERVVKVKAKGKNPAREARVALRYTQVQLPEPSVITPWIKEHRPDGPLTVGVVELREISPPKNAQPIRWVLYTNERVTSLAAAERIVSYYERRPTIEDYHKCLKTGCSVERRQYEKAARLERVVGLLSITAVRLLQLRTAARETPDRPAQEVAPSKWIEMLSVVRQAKASASVMTIREFVRHLAGLGGHLGRKCDGEPGWITLWRGYEKLQLLLRGAEAGKKCG